MNVKIIEQMFKKVAERISAFKVQFETARNRIISLETKVNNLETRLKVLEDL